MHWKQELIAAAGSLILALPAFGQAGMSGAAGTPPDPHSAARPTSDTAVRPAHETAVLGVLHRVNQDEITMANLAKEKSSNKAVKDYADMIISDHKKADDQVVSYAKAHNLDLKEGAEVAHKRMEEHLDATRSREVQTPTGEYARPPHGTSFSDPADEHKKTMDKLSKLSGPEFDRLFVKTMADDHRRLVDHLKTVRSRTRDQEFAQLIDKLSPTLQKHQTTAEQLESSLSKAS